jgi:hypothetical protein
MMDKHVPNLIHESHYRILPRDEGAADGRGDDVVIAQSQHRLTLRAVRAARLKR